MVIPDATGTDLVVGKPGLTFGTFEAIFNTNRASSRQAVCQSFSGEGTDELTDWQLER